MKFSENRLLAWIVLAVVIMGSFISGGGALAKDGADIHQIFYSEVGIYDDLRARAEAAYNIASTAGRYASIDAKLISAVSDARASLMAENSIAAMHQRNEALVEAVESLYTEMQNARMSEADASFARKQYAEFKSRGDTIVNSKEYNRQAEAFNRTLSAFPAYWIGGWFGVKPLELFR